MCIIVAKKRGLQLPGKETLRNCFNYNSDGAGLMYNYGGEVHIEKGLSVIKQKDMIPVAPMPQEFDCEYFSLQVKDVKGGWSMLCSRGENLPKDWQMIYVISSENACIKTDGEKVGKTIFAEDIFAVAPGEKVTVEGKAQLMRIIAK